MIILNYTHPLTDEQREQVQTLLNQMPEVRDIPAQIDRGTPR